VPPEDVAAAEWATRKPAAYAWIVFTSANGVRSFFAHLDARRDDARIFGDAKIAAIGLATCDALRERNVYADFVPQKYVAEDLAEGLLAASKPGDRMLLYRATEARDILPDRLRVGDRVLDIVAGYRTEFVQDPQLAEKVARSDILTFTTSSPLRGFVHNLGDATPSLPNARIIACIGPITAQAAKNAGLPVDVVAPEHTVEGLVDALS